MDIPDTGAIFTLGKSYLAENTQSYFFIKNDPVNRLISGSTQSAVICDSGRLFVWGENQFGQLGVISGNSNDKSSHIITKPTCVKTLKTLGLKVHDAAFGDGWCVILTNTNEIFFTGKNIFSKNTKIYKNFENLNKNENKNISIVKRPFRLKEFNGILLSSSKDNNNQMNNNDEYFDKLSTGNEHFVLITSTGRLFGWGSNKSNQFGLPGNELLSPVELSPDLKITNFICGPKSTLIQTETNQFYITGQLNDLHYSKFTELSFNNCPIPQENVKFLHISKSNEIFFVTEKGNIYRGSESARQQSIIFQRFYDYDNEENGPVVKLLKGTSFFAALTQNYKLFTTFSESGHHLKTFREISKFKNLRVFNIAVGDRHVLVMGVPRSVKNFDKNRFFNKIAAVNTPDLNGTSIGKLENMNHKLINNITGENENKSDVKDEENEQKNIDESDPKSVNQNKPQNQTDGELQETENVHEINGIKSLSDNDNENSKSTNSLEPLSPTKLNKNENQSSSQKPQSEKSHSPENENKIKTPEPSNQVEETISETNQEVDTSISNVPDTSSSSNEQNITRNSSQDTDESKSSQISVKQLQKQQSVNSTSSNKMSNHESSKISDSENLKGENIVNQTTENENKSTNSIENDEATTNVVQISSNIEDKFPTNDIGTSETSEISETKNTPAKEDAKSPSTSQKSRKGSARSIKFDEKSLKSTKSQDRLVRPNTPYPDGTPQTVKRVQNIIQNSNDDMIENTSPNLADSLENIPEMSPQNSASVTRRPSLKYSDRKEKYDEIVRKASAKPALVLNERYLHLEDDENENDEKLEIEIKTDDILDQTTINEIRFINNGIDVTERIQFDEVPSEQNTLQSVSTSDVKQNINNPENSKASEEDVDDTLTKDESKLKVTDDDERTTASVNSNKNENQIENDLELKNNKDDLLIQQNAQQPEQEYDFYQQNDQTESTKSKETRKKKVQRFIDDLKTRGKEMTCHAGESIRVEDDPPRYTSMDEGLDKKTSKVCTIL